MCKLKTKNDLCQQAIHNYFCGKIWKKFPCKNIQLIQSQNSYCCQKLICPMFSWMESLYYRVSLFGTTFLIFVVQGRRKSLIEGLIGIVFAPCFNFFEDTREFSANWLEITGLDMRLVGFYIAVNRTDYLRTPPIMRLIFTNNEMGLLIIWSLQFVKYWFWDRIQTKWTELPKVLPERQSFPKHFLIALKMSNCPKKSNYQDSFKNHWSDVYFSL